MKEELYYSSNLVFSLQQKLFVPLHHNLNVFSDLSDTSRKKIPEGDVDQLTEKNCETVKATKN